MIFNPAHPGEVLRDYLGSMGVAEAASRLGITRAHLSRVLNGHAGITANTSLRLSAALGTSPDFWLKMQMNHDLWLEQQKPLVFKILPFSQREEPKAGAMGSAASKDTRKAQPMRRGKAKAIKAVA
jgi:addiction module HigA family antidote